MKYPRKKNAALFLSVLLSLLGILLSYTYRPYIYSNYIFDFHLADTIGSWVCIPAASLFLGCTTKFPKMTEMEN
jgi:hypothetical protein